MPRRRMGRRRGCGSVLSSCFPHEAQRLYDIPVYDFLRYRLTNAPLALSDCGVCNANLTVGWI